MSGMYTVGMHAVTPSLVFSDEWLLLLLQGTLTLLNIATGLDSVSELEAIGAFVLMLLLTEDLKSDQEQ